MAPQVTRQVRQRKLSTKQSLHIVRENQVERVDDDQPRNIPKVDTGVEKAEEIEHHLQAAISASQAAASGGKIAQIYIPTPDTIQSSIQYERLYPARFSQPATYIRFSSTVEECVGIPYCMTREDDIYLQSMNQKRSTSTRCSPDEFEEVMDFFEKFSKFRQPFAVVDNEPVMSLNEMIQSHEYHEEVDEPARAFATDIYEHWKSKRLKRGHRPVMPSLKVSGVIFMADPGMLLKKIQVETGQETDEGDPYVCFRRREVRQARKTRGHNQQSIEKLRRLRRELEDARKLIALVKQREMTKSELLGVERTLFEQRMAVKTTKRRLGIKTDDDDLINRRPQKEKKTVNQPTSQGPPVPRLHLSLRPDGGRNHELDLVSLSDVLRDKENEIKKEVDERAAGHRTWQNKWPDMTPYPLTPVAEEDLAMNFRKVAVEYMPTPPASTTAESPKDVVEMAADGVVMTDGEGEEESVTIRYMSPPSPGIESNMISYRRRIGRGGRLMIDRRGFRLQSTEGIDPRVQERFKYDRDDDDEDGPISYTVDPHDQYHMLYRATQLTYRELNPQRPGQNQAAQSSSK
ncbi:MAG: Calcineurin subunit B [Watsoniomyces obsoletus]|nr:MAG: Calcineurin subunit B [Watsoniomyces obsoletus]